MCEKNGRVPVGPEDGVIAVLKEEHLLPEMEKETMDDAYE